MRPGNVNMQRKVVDLTRVMTNPLFISAGLPFWCRSVLAHLIGLPSTSWKKLILSEIEGRNRIAIFPVGVGHSVHTQIKTVPKTYRNLLLRLSRTYLIFLLLGLSGYSYAQHPSCKEQLLGAYQGMRKTGNGEGLALSYAVATTYRGEGLTPSHVQVSVQSYGDRSRVENDQSLAFQDAHHLVVIYRESQSLIIMDNPSVSLKEAQLSVVSAFQDSSWNQLMVASCETVCTDGPKNNTTKLVLEANKTLTRYGVTEAIYWIGSDGKIREIALTYGVDHLLDQVTIRFHQWDASYAEVPFKGSAVSQVLTATNELLPPYQEFQLTDKRAN